MSSDILASVEFEDNPEPRCPVVLLLDTSGSMSGRPIQELNEAVNAFAEETKADALASLRIEVAIVTFGGGVEAIDTANGYGTVPFDAGQAFVTVDQFNAPTLGAGGDTPMGEAMRRALQLLRDRKDIYKANDTDYFRPWIVMVTDGGPTDQNWESAADQACAEEDRKGVIVFAFGVEGANLQTLGRFSRQPAMMVGGYNFKELFRWVSKSLSGVSRSRPGDQLPLEPITFVVQT